MPSFMVCETLLWGKIWPCEWEISLMLWCKLKPVCTSAVQASAREGNRAPECYLPALRVKTGSYFQWPVVHTRSSIYRHSHSLRWSVRQSNTNESSTCVSLKDGVKDKAENVKGEKRHSSFILVSGVNSQHLSCVIAASVLSFMGVQWRDVQKTHVPTRKNHSDENKTYLDPSCSHQCPFLTIGWTLTF